MNRAEFALTHPVFDPDRQIVRGHTTWYDDLASVGLTVNIGME